MWYRRLIYLLVLAGVFLFQITNDNYLACFLLALCIALPLLSLALSLPGMLRCRVSLSPSPGHLPRGEAGGWTVEVDTFGGLPLARLTMRLTVGNRLTAEHSTRKLKLGGVARRRPETIDAPTAHCGLLELRADKLRVCDYLGLFVLPLKTPAPARIACRPIPAACQPVEVPDALRGASNPKSAAHAGSGEDYDLREYRPGDPMRAVHWKLSSKWDELIVRERAESWYPLPLLTVDLFGTPEKLDALLDRLTGMSRALLGVQRPHAVLWLDKAGEPQFHPVADEREYALMLEALLRAEAPPKGETIDDRPDALRGLGVPVFRVHITPEGGDGHGG